MFSPISLLLKRSSMNAGDTDNNILRHSILLISRFLWYAPFFSFSSSFEMKSSQSFPSFSVSLWFKRFFGPSGTIILSISSWLFAVTQAKIAQLSAHKVSAVGLDVSIQNISFTISRFPSFTIVLTPSFSSCSCVSLFFVLYLIVLLVPFEPDCQTQTFLDLSFLLSHRSGCF